jgi:hypothetical protein
MITPYINLAEPGTEIFVPVIILVTDKINDILIDLIAN